MKRKADLNSGLNKTKQDNLSIQDNPEEDYSGVVYINNGNIIKATFTHIGFCINRDELNEIPSNYLQLKAISCKDYYITVAGMVARQSNLELMSEYLNEPAVVYDNGTTISVEEFFKKLEILKNNLKINKLVADLRENAKYKEDNSFVVESNDESVLTQWQSWQETTENDKSYSLGL